MVHQPRLPTIPLFMKEGCALAGTRQDKFPDSEMGRQRWRHWWQQHYGWDHVPGAAALEERCSALVTPVLLLL